MYYEEFIRKTVEELRGGLLQDREGFAIQDVSVPRNNNVYKEGIQLSYNNGGSVEQKMFIDLYEFYESSLCDSSWKAVLDDVVQYITNIIEAGLPEPVQEMPYERAKEFLLIDACNAGMNRDQLSCVPHVRKGDLAYRYLLYMAGKGTKNCVLVGNELIQKWGITEETLRSDAWRNMKKKWPPRVLSIIDILEKILGEETEEDDAEVKAALEGCMLHCISNSDSFHGASYMFDGEFMDSLARRFEDDLVLFPSSVHELLFLPRRDVDDLKNVNEMVMEVNNTRVQAEDILSNNIYVYDRKKRNIGIYQGEQLVGWIDL